MATGVRSFVPGMPGAAYEAEHFRDVHGVARSRTGEQLAELRPFQRVEAAGGPGLFLEDDRASIPASSRTRF
ncbi:hypothetical protein [Streptomyces sp.]|uniref:hypothetical protein n=1 Tax=Streptomyces sp. TaxID=1931 RepID=UPI002F3EE619